ncbi:quinol monooxygenase YgiN [Aquimarina sp. MAR_2010_214]|uniref:putative quinol monooxygenase n=1 Tax=Aquimarina sp. MAR_2010_214 TaxID=1250026 RepID=UPI000C7028B3|nr:putative quinol monooxygenase [Aquimarina sp. MAR_2010_214]PKV50999.1 quinol monooxygenase YgiN [Aquimarina sp. MAR_2010_214]
MKKTVIARLGVQKESVEQFLTYAKKMVQESNIEEGCISYSLYQEIDNSTGFIFYEEYTDMDAVNTHNSSNHFKEFISLVSSMLTLEPIIEVF